MEVTIRPLRETDRAFVYATMLRGLYHGNDFYGAIDQDAFYSNYSEVVRRLLNSETTLVATLPDDDDVIIGYAIVGENVLHYSFVKKAFRHNGVFKRLLQGKQILSISHLTRSIKPFMISRGWKLNPFAI